MKKESKNKNSKKIRNVGRGKVVGSHLECRMLELTEIIIFK